MLKLRIIFSILFLNFAVPAVAADGGAQVGVAGGLSAVDADNTKPFVLSGIKGSVYVASAVSIGGYYLASDSSGEASPTETFKYSLLGLDAAYRFNGGAGFFAFRAGLTKVQNNNATGNQLIYSPYHYGIASGYDYPVYKIVTLGFEGSFLRVFPGRTSLSGVTYERDAFNIISFLVTLQFKI